MAKPELTIALNDMRGRGRDGKSAGDNRSILVLVCLFVAAFLVALALQGDSRRRQIEREAIAGRVAEATVLAGRVNAGLTEAWGALAGAAELARSSAEGSVSLGAVASGAGRASAVDGVVLLDGRGRVLATSSQALNAAAIGAQRTAAGAQAWVGAVALPEQLPKIALTRRSGDVTIVSVLNAAELVPDGAVSEGQNWAIAAPDGTVIAASVETTPGASVGSLFAFTDNDATTAGGGIGRFADGRRAAVGRGLTPQGELRVYRADHVPGFPAALWGALVQLVLLALAPLGAVGALLLLLRQNTQRAQVAEAEAERVEAQFKITADGAQAGLFEWRQGSNELQLSEQLQRMLHASKDVLTLQEFVRLVIPEDQPQVERDFQQAVATGALDTRFRITSQAAGGGGVVAWIEARGVAIGDLDSRDAARLFGTAIDVTGRRDAELRASALERRLREAIDSFSGPFALWDSRRRLALCNKTYAKLFRLPPDLVRSGASFEAVGLAATAQVRRERSDPNDPSTKEVELVTGEWLQIVERRTGDGGILTVGVDISALKKQEAALTRSERHYREMVQRLEESEGQKIAYARQADEAKRRAEDASKAKSVFLANMSHELRTPLNAIIGFSEIMTKELFGPISNPQYVDYANDIHESGKHLLDLINDVLDMAKIEAGKYQLSPRPIDPIEAIDQAVRIQRRSAEEKNLKLVIDAQDLPEIEADHRALKQIVLNLLSNSIKFTDEGAVMVHARRNPDDGITLRVIDTGRGIAPEHLPRLGQSFEQVDSELNRNTSGTGLGLALSKSLVEMHGGSLTIESEVGRGTVVTVVLPKAFGAGGGLSAKPAA